MKYTARLLDKHYNVIKSFWFRSQHNISNIELAYKDAVQIVDERGYKYNTIQISPKN
jgi:hypothetical protein